MEYGRVTPCPVFFIYKWHNSEIVIGKYRRLLQIHVANKGVQLSHALIFQVFINIGFMFLLPNLCVMAKVSFNGHCALYMLFICYNIWNAMGIQWECNSEWPSAWCYIFISIHLSFKSMPIELHYLKKTHAINPATWDVTYLSFTTSWKFFVPSIVMLNARWLRSSLIHKHHGVGQWIICLFISGKIDIMWRLFFVAEI